ncbi:uncharacterized protein LOC119791981 [Cyprinodon tularosa]|uniref:uncharacterized protein LOC119791981 n=1 Tax=Cyprinodon tularosa TaxID=77115 RepID=UPI0018E25244|nr:uncharacterized protein LOC119791981 [Cyprinodon tularosa]
MVSNLRKYKYEGTSTTRPSTSSGKSSGSPTSAAPEPSHTPIMDITSIKADILSSLRKDISVVIREELRTVLAEDFESIKRELIAVRSEIANNTTAIHAELDHMKSNVGAVEKGLSTWTDEVVSTQRTVKDLEKLVGELRDKCEDLEGRMRRGNIRIMGVAERPGSSSPAAVSKLLKEVFQMDKEGIVERSHRSLVQRGAGDKPRVIIARLHNEGDALAILRKARDRGGRLQFDGNTISVFPDYTVNVAKARAAFTDVRKMLRGRPGVRFGILYPARFRISYNNEEKEFLDATEAMDYVKKKVIPAAEPEN